MKHLFVHLFAVCLMCSSFAIAQDDASSMQLFVHPSHDFSFEVPGQVGARVVFQNNNRPGVWETRVQLQGNGPDEIIIESYQSQRDLLTWIRKTFSYIGKEELKPFAVGQGQTPGYRYHMAPSTQSYGLEMVFVKDGDQIHMFQLSFAAFQTLNETYDNLLATLVFGTVAGAEEITEGAFPPVSNLGTNTCGGATHVNNCSVATNPFPCCTNGVSSCSGNCTWWAWEQACKNWSINVPPRGNANSWDESFATAGYNKSTTPIVGRIAVSNAGTYGHVAYVTSISGSNVTVTEQNCIQATCTGNWCCGMRSKTYDKSYFDGGYWKN